jgi:uncharacterized repeat protein (TIGR02543 family)
MNQSTPSRLSTGGKKYRMKNLSRAAARIFAAILLSTIVALLLPAIETSADEAGFKCWAVFIGLSEYQHIDSSAGCAEAETTLHETISRIWGEEHCRLLTNDEATKYNIREATNWLADNAESDDTVLIYYAGHGDPSGYLSTYQSYYIDTWIAATEMKSWLYNIKSQKLTVILDSCHSGSFIPHLKHDGRVILASSETNEVSYVIPDAGGIFTGNLLDAIKNFINTSRVKDFNLSAEEMFAFAETETVQDTTDYTKTIQHPTISDEYEGEISLLIHFVLVTNPVIPPKTEIYDVDGETYLRTDILTWAPGSAHNIEALTPLDTGKGTKYLFSSWEDNTSTPVRIISTEGKYTANYDIQHRLEIVSDHSSPEGQGWYAEGSIAIVSVQSIDRPTEKHHFNGWSGDYSGDENTVQITMDAPKTITANWHSEYLINVISDQGEPTGAGWYDEGDIAKITIKSIEGPDAKHHFAGWTGDFDGSNNSFEITMDNPKSITANWHSEYLLTIESDWGETSGSGWYDDGDVAKVTVESTEDPDAKHYFAGWTGDFEGSNNSFEITMDNPKSITANWHSEYLITIESDYGEATGEGWYDEGTRFTISVPNSNGFLVRQVFDGWSGDFDGTASTEEIEINRAMSIRAEWRTDYVQLYILLGALVILVTTIYFIFLRRRRRVVI